MAADPAFAARHSLTPQEGRAAFGASFDLGGAVVLLGSATRAGDGAPVPAAHGSPHQEVGPKGAAGLGSAAPDRARAVSAVSGAFRAVLGEDPGEVALEALGLDSITVAELAAAIESRTGSPLDPSVLLRARGVADVADVVAGTAPRSPSTTTDHTPAATAPGADLRTLLTELDDTPRTDGKA
ncbi:hypothetical protein Ae717Ps2_2247c [Pseudonocardia sp. Ae717_Ps2]|uniref:acyl carrier protein n=2 Tax=unclassified Pseudonocardia TaxID=2619320 RepID=UPI00094AD717|nr:acyl carrier protein [Pseudonocardia sp. Ae717_Ps2]OLM31352.1 hypothetical protein Ae717Ps2_2247c [Pseudonocardia sp. Ae717_Ps2]